MNASDAHDHLGPLTREHGCLGNFQWRCRLSGTVNAQALARALANRGYARRTCLPFLQVLRLPSGHEIVIVPATGRVQLRVGYLTPETQRTAAALDLFQDLLQSVQQISDIKSPLSFAGKCRETTVQDATVASPAPAGSPPP